MAWHEEAMAQAAGALVSDLDTYLVTNSNWAIYDTPAANQRVYQQYDAVANSEFYFYVDDTQALYSIVELWEGWNAGAHSGTGNVQPTVASGKTCYIRKSAGLFAYRVKDLNLIIANEILYQGHYVGQLQRCDTTKNMPLLVANYTTIGTYVASINPLGAGGDYAALDPNAHHGFVLNDVLAAEDALIFGNSHSQGRYIRSSDGRYYLSDTLVHGESSTRVFGSYEGVCALGQAGNSLNALDLLWVGAQSWIALTGSSRYCVIEKS